MDSPRCAVRARLQSGRWQRLHRGVYLAHSEPVGNDAAAWAVLLAAGEDALPSHDSALWVWGVGPLSAQWSVLVPTAKVCQKGLTTPERIIEELASRRAPPAETPAADPG